MPKLFIHLVNSEFRSRDEGFEYGRAEDAFRTAVRGAATIAVDEIQKGRPTAAVEIRIEREDGRAELRSVVCMAVSTLLPG
jgi:hypothetical protein